MKTEKSGLWLSAVAAFVVGGVGIAFALITNSQAILLDGAFNVVYFLAALLTLWVARLAALPDTEEFPLGYTYFEPFMNGIKGLLILGVSLLAIYDSVSALLTGGRTIVVGPAIGYAVFATAACATTALLLRRVHRHSKSPLVGADAASWMVNAAISGTVLLVFGAIPIIEEVGWSTLVPYVDPFLVSVMVTISLFVPIRMAWRALLAMLNRAPAPDLRAPIKKSIDEALGDLPSREIYVRMVQPGRVLILAVHVVLPKDYKVESLAALDDVRNRVEAAVQEHHPLVVVDVLFTASKKWAAPQKVAAATSLSRPT